MQREWERGGKKRIGCNRLTFLSGMEGVCWTNDLPSVDQVISDWFKIPFLGEVESVIKLSLVLVTWGLTPF